MLGHIMLPISSREIGLLVMMNDFLEGRMLLKGVFLITLILQSHITQSNFLDWKAN
jgi:hypothetical protein